MLEIVQGHWPWYVAGPILGLMVPILLFLGNKHFGVSSSFQHICAAVLPVKKIKYFQYNWKDKLWSIVTMAGVVFGAFVAVLFLDGDQLPAITDEAKLMFVSWGILDFSSLQPAEVYGSFFSIQNVVLLGVGGFLVGFGTRYANGCTSGHAIMGLSLLNPGSLAATISFFGSGILVSQFIVPVIMQL